MGSIQNKDWSLPACEYLMHTTYTTAWFKISFFFFKFWEPLHLVASNQVSMGLMFDMCIALQGVQFTYKITQPKTIQVHLKCKSAKFYALNVIVFTIKIPCIHNQIGLLLIKFIQSTTYPLYAQSTQIGQLCFEFIQSTRLNSALCRHIVCW